MKLVSVASLLIFAILISESESGKDESKDNMEYIQRMIKSKDWDMKSSLEDCEEWKFAKFPTFKALSDFKKKKDGEKVWIFVKVEVNEKDKSPRYTQAVLYREYGSILRSKVKYMGKKHLQTKDASVCVDIENCFYDRTKRCEKAQ